MSFTFLPFHKGLFNSLLICISLICFSAFSIGELKPSAELNVIDAVGEGGIAFMTLIWIFFTLISRPAGRVTNLLFFGLLFTHTSVLLDFIDEFVTYPDNHWLSNIEALPATLGMILMSVGLYRLHQEQTTINNQLSRTERFYREHSLVDFTTGLYSAEYMKQQIKLEINHAKNQKSLFSLMMFDLCDFAKFNEDHGYQHGDMLLSKVAQIIQMNIRDGDIACRYASDRFIILMPNTQQATAQEIQHQTQCAIEHLAFKHGKTSDAIYPEVNTCSHQYRGWHNLDDVLNDINDQLAHEKQAKTQVCNA